MRISDWSSDVCSSDLKAITALYAFCREVDDVVDECTDPSVARMKLAWWRSQIESMYAGKAEHPVTQALEPHVHAYDLSADRLYAIVEGMEMDLDQDRYADWARLRTRAEERRVGKECVSTCRYRGWQ